MTIQDMARLTRVPLAVAAMLALAAPAQAQNQPLGIFGGDQLKRKLAETEQRARQAEEKLEQEIKAREKAEGELQEAHEALQEAQAKLSKAVNRCKTEKQAAASSSAGSASPGTPDKSAGKTPLPEPKMVRIPEGSFQMGCDKNVKECDADEFPVHEVAVKAFELGKYELTFAEWDACEAARVCPHVEDSGWGRGRRPVTNISWDDVQIYIGWLNGLPGQDKQYRLPTEEEWEYAARAGTATPFSTGMCITTQQANYDGAGDYDKCPKSGRYLARTQPVGLYPANPWGLHDMQGNVSEWMQDCYGETYGKPEGGPESRPSEHPGEPAEKCVKRVFRGGSWGDSPRKLRSAERDWFAPATRIKFVGFRLARTIEPSAPAAAVEPASSEKMP